MDNDKEVSIDAALVRVADAMHIDQNDNVLDANSCDEKHSMHDIGMQSTYLNQNCILHIDLSHLITKPTVKAVSAWAVSGLSSINSPVKICDDGEPFTLEQITDIYWNTIKDDVKVIAGSVFQNINNKKPRDIPSRNDIKDILANEDKLENNIKEAVCDIVLRYYTDVQMQYRELTQEFNEILETAIYREVNTNYSAFVRDVHTQTAFLQKCHKRQILVRTNRRMYGQLYITNISAKMRDSGSCIYAIDPNHPRGCVGMLIATFPDKKGCIATPITKILDAFGVTYS